jgi:cytoskeletal protein RodZ
MEGLGLFTVFTIIAVLGCLIAIVFAVVSERNMRLIVSVSIGVLLLIVGGGAVTGAYDADNQLESAATNKQVDDTDDDSDYDDESDDDSDTADEDTSADDSDYEDESSTDTTSTEDDSLDEDTDATTEADTTSSSSSVVVASSSSYTAPVSSSSSYRAPSSSASSRVTNGYHRGGGRSYAYKPVPQTGQTETVYVSAQIPGRYHKDPNCRGLARYGGAQAVSLARAQQMGYTAFCAYERYGR